MRTRPLLGSLHFYLWILEDMILYKHTRPLSGVFLFLPEAGNGRISVGILLVPFPGSLYFYAGAGMIWSFDASSRPLSGVSLFLPQLLAVSQLIFSSRPLSGVSLFLLYHDIPHIQKGMFSSPFRGLSISA